VQDIFDRIGIGGFGSIHHRACREITDNVLQSLNIPSGAMRKKKRSWLSILRAHHMNFAAINVARLAWQTPPKEGALIPRGAWPAIMITDSHRTALNDRHHVIVEGFSRMRSQVTYRQKGIFHLMEPLTAPALAAHCGEIPRRFAHHAGTLQIAAQA
jgi:hypothetical protein